MGCYTNVPAPRVEISSCKLWRAKLLKASDRRDENPFWQPQGELPERPKAGEESDFFFVEAQDPGQGAAKVVEIVRDIHGVLHRWRE